MSNQTDTTVVDYIIAYIDTEFGIIINNAVMNDDTINGQVYDESCEVTVEYTSNELTGEIIEVTMYSDDLPDIDGETIDRIDTAHDDFYDELNANKLTLSDDELEVDE